MKILFISQTTVGGSGRSQRELAQQLRSRGHDVWFLVDDDRPAPVSRWLYAQLSDLSVRLAPTRAAGVVDRIRDAVGARTSDLVLDGLPHRACAVPQNALPSALRRHRPDVVVVNSVERWAWRRIAAMCRLQRTPTVLYVREVDSLEHPETGDVPTVLVANARSLTERLRRRGFDCAFIPSVVDTATTRTRSSREVALSINPVPDKGGDLFWSVAELLPDVRFVIQESWPLTSHQVSEVMARLESLSNVEFRRRSSAGPGLYRDARVVLVPYRVDSRPRVILEAQANAIPVVVGDVPGLVEAVGPGGLTVPLESVDDWVAAVRGLWDDDTAYDTLSAAALAHSARAEVDPVKITDTFEGVLNSVIGRTAV